MTPISIFMKNKKQNFTSVNRLMRPFIISLLLSLLLTIPGFCQELDKVLTFIRNPQEMVEWFDQDFINQWEMPDDWQNPQQTLNSKKGDCEDFAILSKAILDRLGYAADILIVKFNRLNIGHAICIFKDNQDAYSFVSNKKLTSTGKKTIEEAIDKFYPDWESIIFTDPDKEYTKTILKDKQRKITYRNIQTALK